MGHPDLQGDGRFVTSEFYIEAGDNALCLEARELPYPLKDLRLVPPGPTIPSLGWGTLPATWLKPDRELTIKKGGGQYIAPADLVSRRRVDTAVDIDAEGIRRKLSVSGEESIFVWRTIRELPDSSRSGH